MNTFSYDGSQWRFPPWMGGGTVPRDAGRNLQQFAGSELMLSFSVPSLDRHSTPDLDAEGLIADRLASMLHQSQGAGRDSDILDTGSTASVGEPTYSTTQTMPSNNTNSDGADASETPSHGLIRTTGPDGFDEIDPQLQAALDGSLTEAEISKVIAAQKQAAEKAQDTEIPPTEAESSTDAKTSSSGEEESGESDTEVDVDDSPDEVESSAGTSTTTTDAEHADGRSEVQDATTTNDTTDEDHEQSPQQKANAEDTGGESTVSGPEEAKSPAMETLQLNPAAVALADQALAAGSEAETITMVISTAVSEYVAALLAGDAAGTEEELFEIDFQGSPAAEGALRAVVDDEVESLSALAAEGIAAAISSDNSVSPRD